MKYTIAAVLVIALALVLFIPIPQGPLDDGGTRTYNAFTYKIVVWNKLYMTVNENGQGTDNCPYQKTSVFWLPNNLKSIDELWEMEIANK